MRESIQPTYDSRETGLRYHVTTTVNGRIVTWRQPIPDPFARTTVTVGWRDILRGLFARRLIVEVTVGAPVDLVDDVLELDADTLLHNSSRRREFDQGVTAWMRQHAPEADGGKGDG